MKEKILTAIKELKEKSKKRNFPQSFDLIINLKEFDVKKPENRISEDIVLPHGKGKDVKIVVFSDSLENPDVEVLGTNEINKMARDKRKIKKMARDVNFFLAEPKLMPLVGKTFGQALGPRGKIPKILTGNAKDMINNYKKSVRIRVKESPVIQCIIGKEDMKNEEVAENVEAVLKFLEHRLPKGKNNLGKIMLKLTMSKPVKVEV